MGECGRRNHLFRDAGVSLPFRILLTKYTRVFDSLVRRGLTPHVAWRVSFVTVPFVLLITIAITILLFAPDSPTGPWKDRHLNATIEGIEASQPSAEIVDVGQYGMEEGTSNESISKSKPSEILKDKDGGIYDVADVNFAEATLVEKPSAKGFVHVLFSFPTFMVCSMYFVTFGGELAINSNLSSFYIEASGKPAWSQTLAANWAAMYGLLNVITRPLGGYIGDLLYPVAGIEGKKYWVITCITFETRMLTLKGGLAQGIVLTTIGFVPNIKIHSLIAAVAIAAIFTDAGNGANFAVVPHVHPANNGIISGLTGASGNLGGIIFALIFRFNGSNYHKSYWIIGLISIALSVLVSWIRVPKVR